MNRKQLTLILVAFVVLGGLGLWLRSRNESSYQPTYGQMGQKVLGDFDVNAVTRIAVTQGTNTLTLAQKGDKWVVTERADYPANFSEIGETLRKLWELKVTQPVPGPLGAAAFERLGVSLNGTNKTAILVQLFDKDGKALRSLVLGKPHVRQAAAPSPMGGDGGWPDGRYLMVKDQPNSVCLVAETFTALEPRPETWLSKDFFKVEKVKSLAVTYPNATNSWKLSRASETNDWVLADLAGEEKLDAGKVSGVANALGYPSFVDVVVDPNPTELGLEQPTVAVLETTDGFTYTLKAGKKAGDDANYYFTLAVAADFPKERTPGANEKPEDKEKLDKEFKDKTDRLAQKLKSEKALEGRVFQVNKWTLDSLLKNRHDLLVEKKDEKKDAAGAALPPNPVDSTLPPALPGADDDKEEQ